MAAILFPPNDTPSTARSLYTVTPWEDLDGKKWLWNEAKLRWSPYSTPGAGGGAELGPNLEAYENAADAAARRALIEAAGADASGANTEAWQTALSILSNDTVEAIVDSRVHAAVADARWENFASLKNTSGLTNEIWARGAKFTTTFETLSGLAATSTGYVVVLRWDGSWGPVAGAGIPLALVNIDYGTAPAAPYDSLLPKFVGVFSCDAMGDVSSGNLILLDISGCGITTFDGRGLTALEVLNLTNNQLTYLSLVGMTALTNVIADANQLVGFACGGNPNLASMSMMDNSLARFGPVSLPALVDLYLGANRLTFFSGVGMGTLSLLDLNTNLLSQFSGEGLTSLTLLDLTGNLLTSFVFGGALSNVGAIYASNNQLTEFDTTDMSSLTELVLTDNPITTFVPWSATPITSLRMEGSLLTEFNAQLSALAVLILSNSSLLTNISCIDLPSLTDLEAPNCALTSFSAAGSPLLSRLILHDNLMTAVDVDGAVLSYSYHSATGSDLSNNLLDDTALDAFYTSLGVDTGYTGIISVYGNPGTATDDPSIANAKNYTIQGT